mmetsp:Transcript_11101/g.24853  ORF Transcript_11101/g.24853 Transcript_11101/m.24853 type:complete len:250 (-) Transcript_11101:33-782(-)
MNGVVHDAKQNTGGGLVDVGMPAVQENRNVMVPVQQEEGLFVNDNEKGIQELGKFGQAKELHPQSDGATAKVRFGIETQIFLPRIRGIEMHNGRGRSTKPNAGKDAEQQIPRRQGPPPIPSVATVKVSSAEDNAHGVQDASDNGNDGMFEHPIANGDGVVFQFRGEIGGPQAWIQTGKLFKGKTADIVFDARIALRSPRRIPILHDHRGGRVVVVHGCGCCSCCRNQFLSFKRRRLKRVGGSKDTGCCC